MSKFERARDELYYYFFFRIVSFLLHLFRNSSWLLFNSTLVLRKVITKLVNISCLIRRLGASKKELILILSTTDGMVKGHIQPLSDFLLQFFKRKFIINTMRT